MAERLRKGLDDLIWRVRLRAIQSTIELLLENKMLRNDPSATGWPASRGELLTGALGGNVVGRDAFVDEVMRRVRTVPLSREEPIRVLDDVTPWEVSLDGVPRSNG